MRGAFSLLFDLNRLNSTTSQFLPKKVTEIKVAFINFIKTKFWINYQYLCLGPILFLIYTIVECMIKHHNDVKNYIQEPPSRCTELNQRMFGSFTRKGFQEEIDKKQDFFGNLNKKYDDLSDFCKDNVYFFVYQHGFLSSLLLSITIVLPAIKYHVESELTDGLPNSFLMYLGLTKVRSLLEDSRLIGGLQIALYENIPQFVI